jgi:AraC family transcriptional regulator
MNATQAAPLTPRFAKGDPMRVIGLGERYDEAAMARIPEQWTRLQERLPEVRGRIDPAQLGLLYQLSESPFALEYVTGVMVADDAPLPEGLVERRLPACRYAVFSHRGHVSGLRPLLDAIFREWLPRSEEAASGDPDFIEVYGDDFDPARLEGVIEVWVPLRD